jgi:hypothetical protein
VFWVTTQIIPNTLASIFAAPSSIAVSARQEDETPQAAATMVDGQRCGFVVEDVAMDWLWPLYEEHIRRETTRGSQEPGDAELKAAFLEALARSTATLYVMEPVGDTIRFKGLGRWTLAQVPALLADPNAFIADLCGGGKFKVNFHHGASFVATHNFRTFGEETWRQIDEVRFEDE